MRAPAESGRPIDTMILYAPDARIATRHSPHFQRHRPSVIDSGVNHNMVLSVAAPGPLALAASEESGSLCGQWTRLIGGVPAVLRFAGRSTNFAARSRASARPTHSPFRV